jgi:lipopolysaccharide/colanic/teichoic acid biosynthesis glycosyltransferase
MKRIFDLVFSLIGLIIFSPIILITALSIWLNDFGNPFYSAMRMGQNMRPFIMYKFRSMIINADKNGVMSTSGSDERITSVGIFIRKFKLDEISQLLNVFLGDMSLVGPRPQIVEYVLKEYTEIEKPLLSIKPGITDISSIVFSDEGDILNGSVDPDKAYNLLIRPWKSRLGLLYVNRRNFILDIIIIILTIIAIINKPTALKVINKILVLFKVEDDLIEVCLRKKNLA